MSANTPPISNDPKQVIVSYLSAPTIVESESAAPGTQGWRTRISRGGYGACPDSFQFLKARSIPHRQVHAVTFEDANGWRIFFACYLTQDANGLWSFTGGAGGGIDGSSPPSPHPWANLGGSWGRELYAGGYVIDAAHTVTRVRLVSANGVALEDTVDDGLVLFLTDQRMDQPITAELYNSAGSLLASHSVFPTKRP